MQGSLDGNEKSKKSIRQLRPYLNTVLLLFIVVAISAGVGLGVGYQLGKREGARLAVRKVTDFLNPVNAVSDNPLFPSTTVGTTTAISESSITVKMPNGKEKKIPLNKQTRVTKQDKELSVKNVAKNSQVTVFAKGRDKDLIATRIVIR